MIPPRRITPSSKYPDLPPKRIPTPQKLSVSEKGMVSTQHYLATAAGVEMLTEGGNAIDAAVAAALALGVCEPAASGLGGQTMMLIHLAKTRKTIAVDGSSVVPHRAAPGTLTEKECRRGYKSSTVPSTPRTLSYTLKRHGSLPWSRVIEPAIRLAESGIEVTELFHALTKRELKHLKKGSASQYFLKEGKRQYKIGENFKQPVLAQTLTRLAKRGVKDFYNGRIARAIHNDMIKNGGLIRKDDLAQMQPPIERNPIATWFEHKRVMTGPPPAAGRTLVQMLNVFNHLPKRLHNIDSLKGALTLANVMKRAYTDRQDRPFDRNFYPQVTDKRIISLEYARKLARKLRKIGDTTHLSVMDKYGNAVALTQSIESVYGATVAAEDLGFLYNNYMLAFEYEDIGHPYFLRPGGVPWASVAPTIVFKGRKPWLTIGSPGSERITAAIFQVLLRLRNQSPFDAVDAPRLYCNMLGEVSLEAARMRDDLPEYLQSKGFELDIREPYAFYMGCVQMVLKEGDSFVGVADPRRDGSAGGPH